MLYLKTISGLSFTVAKQMIDQKYGEGANLVREATNLIDDYVDIYCQAKQSLMSEAYKSTYFDANTYNCVNYVGVRISDEEIDQIALDITERCIKDLLETTKGIVIKPKDIAILSKDYYHTIVSRIKNDVLTPKQDDVPSL